MKDKSKKIILITPFFAPESHAAVFRMHKLAKFLPQRGWEVFVICTDTNYTYNENKDLLKELPQKGLKIYRESYVEPSLRGLRMLLTGEDRTFWGLKKRNSHGSQDEGKKPESIQSASSVKSDFKNSSDKNVKRGSFYFFKKVFQKIYLYILNHHLYVPDRFWTWKRAAYKRAKKLIREEGVEIVLTTSPPFSTLEIGKKLKKNFDIFWVCDQRDPMTYSSKNFSDDPKLFLKQREIEKDSLIFADKITVTTSSHISIFADIYGAEVFQKVEFIPTGMDMSLVESSEKKVTDAESALVYVGEYLEGYGDLFFKIISQIKDHPDFQSHIKKVVFIGHKQINESRLEPILKKYNLLDLVEFKDQMSQKKLYQFITSARAAILCAHPHYPWWCLFSKLVDYIALEKSVLAVVPNPSESRRWLESSGLGIFLDGTEKEASQVFLNFLKNSDSNKTVHKSVVQKFLVDHQVDMFEKVFDSLSKDKKLKYFF